MKSILFQLNAGEAEKMRSQIVTATKRNIRFAPYAFTEQKVSIDLNCLVSAQENAAV